MMFKQGEIHSRTLGTVHGPIERLEVPQQLIAMSAETPQLRDEDHSAPTALSTVLSHNAGNAIVPYIRMRKPKS